MTRTDMVKNHSFKNALYWWRHTGERLAIEDISF